MNKYPCTPEMIEKQFVGAGLGRKTLEDVCQQIGIDINQAKKKLS